MTSSSAWAAWVSASAMVASLESILKFWHYINSNTLCVKLLTKVVSIGGFAVLKSFLLQWSMFRLYLLFPLASSMFVMK